MSGSLGRVGPIVAMVVVLVLSATLGYLWAASSVEITNTGPWQLHPSYQGIYVQTVADAYASDGNDALAADRLSFLCQQNSGLNSAFDDAQQRYGSDQTKSQSLDQLRVLVQSGAVTENTSLGVCNLKSTSLPFPSILPLIGLILMGIVIVGAGVFRMINASEEAGIAPAMAPSAASAPAAPGSPPVAEERTRSTLPGFGRKKPDDAGETVRSAAARGAQISAEVEKTDFESTGSEPPIVQFMTTYLHGDDLYDDSFSIETPSGEFLGECGVGISETIGSSDVKSVTAFEVWLFDKNDIRTVTKVLMSDHAFNDDSIRARLAPKGEAVKAEASTRVMLETASLRVQARIVDISYSSGAMPPNSVFDRITIELASWKRDGQTSGGAGPMVTPRRDPPPNRVNLPGAPTGGSGTPPTGSPPYSG